MGTLLLSVLLAVAAPTTRPADAPPQTAADVLRPVCESLAEEVSEADYDAARVLLDGGNGDAAAAVLNRVQPQLDAVADAVKLPSGGGQWMNLKIQPAFAADWTMQIHRLATLAAADAVRKADAAAAFGRLDDLLRLAKLLVDQPDLTLVIYGRNVGQLAMTATGRVAPRLTAEQAAKLRDHFLALRQTAAAEAVRQNGRTIDLALSRMGNAFGDMNDIDPLLLPLLDLPPDARQTWENPLERDRMTRALRLAHEATADSLDATGDARAAKIAEAKRRVADAGWLGNAAGPSVDLYVAAHDRFAAWFTLAAAALEVRTRGPAALADYADPTDGRPFDYAALDGGGFVLTSRQTIKDQPLTFRVEGVVASDKPRHDVP